MIVDTPSCRVASKNKDLPSPQWEKLCKITKKPQYVKISHRNMLFCSQDFYLSAKNANFVDHNHTQYAAEPASERA